MRRAAACPAFTRFDLFPRDGFAGRRCPPNYLHDSWRNRLYSDDSLDA
jgi:hypothetical protein